MAKLVLDLHDIYNRSYKIPDDILLYFNKPTPSWAEARRANLKGLARLLVVAQALQHGRITQEVL